MLKISSRFSGENSSIEGTLVVNGVQHTFDCEGSASERGTTAVIDGVAHWWCGAYDDNPEMEKLILDIFCDAVDFLVREGGDEDDDWDVDFDGEKYLNLVMQEPDEDEDD